MTRTLYVSDLDGTLLSADSRLTAATENMLNGIISEGALFTVATARTPATVYTLLQNVRLRLPAIVMTGTAMWRQDTGRMTDTVTIPPATVGMLLEVYRRHGLPTFVYTFREGRILIYHIGKMSAMERDFMNERAGSPYKEFLIPVSGDSELPSPLEDVALLYSMQPTQEVRETYEDIRAHIDVNPLYYHDSFGPETGILEVFPPQASKANALRRLAEQVKADRLVVFGDNINDLPMMRLADVAVAVENAVEEVKAEADIVIGPNTSVDNAPARAYETVTPIACASASTIVI